MVHEAYQFHAIAGNSHKPSVLCSAASLAVMGCRPVQPHSNITCKTPILVIWLATNLVSPPLRPCIEHAVLVT
jgi:hypothetical protein